jgi:hypothetical protein
MSHIRPNIKLTLRMRISETLIIKFLRMFRQNKWILLSMNQKNRTPNITNHINISKPILNQPCQELRCKISNNIVDTCISTHKDNSSTFPSCSQMSRRSTSNTTT